MATNKDSQTIQDVVDEAVRDASASEARRQEAAQNSHRDAFNQSAATRDGGSSR